MHKKGISFSAISCTGDYIFIIGFNHGGHLQFESVLKKPVKFDQRVKLQFSAQFEEYFVPLHLVNFLPFYALAFLSVYVILSTVFVISSSPLTKNIRILLVTCGESCNRRRNEISASCASHCFRFVSDVKNEA